MEVATKELTKKTVPEGYKRTEVGLIPEDWKVKKLVELTPEVNKYGIVDGPFGSNLKSEHYRKKGIPVISSGFVTQGRFEGSDYNFVDKSKFLKEKRSAVAPGDIVMAKIGARCGISAIMPDGHEIGLLSGNALKISIDELKYSKYFVWQYLFHLYKTGGIDDIKTTGAQPAISITNLRKIKVPLPPNLEEQRVIAEALSGVDELIASLDTLIEKKQKIKKGTMQQLLTGKKRLPGFRREWEEKSFYQCFHFLKSGTNSRSDLSNKGSIGYIHYGDIHAKWTGVLDCDNDSIPCINQNKVKHLPQLEEGDLILADASEDYEGIGAGIEVRNVNGRKIVAGLHTILLRAKDDCLADGFKAYITSIKKVKKSLIEVATGTTVYGISKSKLMQVDILLPPTIEEQKAIAQILGDMDEEIQSLQQKRAKYQKIKQGMMQELLTGKTRLVKEEQEDSSEINRQGHNWEFDEAVLASVLTDRFGSKKYPLGRFKRTKFNYLVRRFLESKVDRFLNKAAGPYNPETRYRGPEKIALKNGYVKEWGNGKYSGLIADENIEKALSYFEKWHGMEAIDWLEERFKYAKNEDLELLTTVDMARVELKKEARDVTLSTIKDVIESHPEWKPKLERDIFSDGNIKKAIRKSINLFGK
ncbi:MAG TPA: restriction endonuclease subunit S [Balneolaceae bacterium]